jgi:hypothetical protein
MGLPSTKGGEKRLGPADHSLRNRCPFLCHPVVTGFPTSPLSPVPLMWFSLKRTTCSRPKPQLSTGNLGKPTCPGVPWGDLKSR